MNTPDCATLLPFVRAFLGFTGVCLTMSLGERVTNTHDLIFYAEKYTYVYIAYFFSFFFFILFSHKMQTTAFLYGTSSNLFFFLLSKNCTYLILFSMVLMNRNKSNLKIWIFLDYWLFNTILLRYSTRKPNLYPNKINYRYIEIIHTYSWQNFAFLNYRQIKCNNGTFSHLVRGWSINL